MKMELSSSLLNKKALSLLIFMVSIFFAVDLQASKLELIKEKSFQVKPGGGLQVEASGADVKIMSWDKEEVHVKIFGNERAREKMRFEIEQAENGVRVLVKKRSSWSFFEWGGYDVKIEAMVPKNYNPGITTSGGDISVYSLTGRFELKTSGGDVSSKDTNGELMVRTSGGDITLTNHNGNSDISTSGGDIRTIKMNGNLRASTSGGDVDVDCSNGKVSVGTSGGDVTVSYSGDGRGIKATTSGGDIRIKVPADIKAKVDLETHGGEIDCNFNNSKNSKVKRGEFHAEFNGGGELLYCSTSGGDIIITEK
ncbi:MAG: DUF4097 family beta strand repeat protein [Ignavibacteriales bacterium]|nr:DUF4097 family beta strand repeat protein [Ignavibacteriales bacterium]